MAWKDYRFGIYSILKRGEYGEAGEGEDGVGDGGDIDDEDRHLCFYLHYPFSST